VSLGTYGVRTIVAGRRKFLRHIILPPGTIVPGMHAIVPGYLLLVLLIILQIVLDRTLTIVAPIQFCMHICCAALGTYKMCCYCYNCIHTIVIMILEFLLLQLYSCQSVLPVRCTNCISTIVLPGTNDITIVLLSVLQLYDFF